MIMDDNNKMAITPKGLRLLLAGFIVMVAGFILLAGGGSSDPQVFNYAMFDFRSTTLPAALRTVTVAGALSVELAQRKYE